MVWIRVISTSVLVTLGIVVGFIHSYALQLGRHGQYIYFYVQCVKVKWKELCLKSVFIFRWWTTLGNLALQTDGEKVFFYFVFFLLFWNSKLPACNIPSQHIILGKANKKENNSIVVIVLIITAISIYTKIL